MGTIWPNAIVIDKSQIEFSAITQAIIEDIWCWKNRKIGREQTNYLLLLCWFHATKAWVEHFLAKLLDREWDDLFNAMCSTLESLIEEEVDAMYQRLKTIYANNNLILKYVDKRWIGDNSQWKCMWARWSIMFPHGYVHTTNLVERMWQNV